MCLSGGSTNGTARLRSEHQWVKVHLITGVNTNVITSVEVTTRETGDCSQFQPLLESTAKRFAVSVEVNPPVGLDTKKALSAAKMLIGAGIDVINIADGPRAYGALVRNRAWRRLSAVRNHKVYLEPTYPFGIGYGGLIQRVFEGSQSPKPSAE